MRGFLLFFSVIVTACKSFEIDLSGCGATKTCIRSSEGCEATTTTCLIFTYAWTANSKSFNMEISGGSGAGNQYVAVAFSPSGKMQDADLYYCTGTELKSGSIEDLHKSPVTDKSLPPQITKVQSSTSNGVAQCSFRRAANVSKEISGGIYHSFDLVTKNYSVLLAVGNYSGGSPQYHGNHNRYSSGPYNFTTPLTTSSEVDLSGCGINKTCVRSSDGCKATNATCLIFTYAWNSSSKSFNMEISGGSGAGNQYVAVAFSPSGKMQDADLYYCTGTELKSGSIEDLHKSPVTDKSLPPQITNVRSSTSNGVAQCSFRRAANVSKEISGGIYHSFDLATKNYSVLLAVGNYSGGSPQYHGNHNRYSSGPYNFTAPLTTSSEVDLSGCGINKTCVRSSDGCKATNATCLIFTYAWNSSSKSFNMEISGGSGAGNQYVAVAFSPSGKMQDADLYYCTGTELKSGSIEDLHKSPVTDKSLPPQITNVRSSTSNGVAQCSFRRAANVSKEISGGIYHSFDLATKNYSVLLAVGNYSGGSPQYHGNHNRYSSGPYNFTAPLTTSSEVDLSGCGINKTCVRSSDGCKATNATCLIFTYAWNSSSKSFNMEISGGSGAGNQYVAVAFSPSGKMQDADLYYCTGTELKSGSIEDLHKSPVTDKSLPPQITNVRSSTSNGVAQCSFRRAANVSKEISGGIYHSFDLATKNYSVLLAVGNYSGGSPQYHGNHNRYSSGPYNFTTPLKTSSEVDLSGCGINKTCVRSSDGCKATNATCLIFTYAWNSSSKSFNMEISGGSGAGNQYVAVAFSPSGKMQDADLYYCTGTELKSGSIENLHKSPVTDKSLPPQITNVRSSTSNGVAQCSFRRAANVSKEISGEKYYPFDLVTKNYSVLLAVGNYSGGSLQYHGKQNRYSSGPYNFTASLTSFSINLSGCGINKTCVQSSDGCKATNATCLIFTYAWNFKLKTFDMEISGGSGAGNQYVAVAFSPSGKMQDADLYYCTGTELKSGSIEDLHKSPVTDKSLPPQITNVRSSTSNGVAQCSFRRAANMSKEISGGKYYPFDLVTKNYSVLLAVGNYTNGALQYHGKANRYSTGPYNFTASPKTPSHGGNNITHDCGVTKGCFTEPKSCTPGTSGCMFLSWKYDQSTNMVNFNIIGGTKQSLQYAAIAFGIFNKMQDADLYYCTEKDLHTGVIRTLGEHPIVAKNKPPEIEIVKLEMKNGLINCSFMRPASQTRIISDGVALDFDFLNSKYYLLYAVGVTDAAGNLTIHSAKAISSNTLNFTAISGSSGPGSSINLKLIKVHASLMLIAWITCASIGVILARHFKPMWPNMEFGKHKVWFHLHRGLMMIVLLATLSGFITIFVAVKGYSADDGAHPIIGIIVTALVIINPIMGFCRPPHNTPQRPIFKWAHGFVGTGARVLAIAAMFLGVDLSVINLPEIVTWLLFGFVVFQVIFEVIFELTSAYYRHTEAYKVAYGLVHVKTDEHDEREDVLNKGASIKCILLVIYIVINLSFLVFLLYHII